MKLKLFSVKDQKATTFNSPFASHNERDATHNVRHLVNDKRSLPGQYPKDFDLYLLGEFDDQTGKLIPLDHPQHIESCINLVDETLQKSNQQNQPLEAVQNH